MLLAIVPAAPPTRKNQRATSCPAPISAKVPYFVLSRLIWTAFWCVSSRVDCIMGLIPGCLQNPLYSSVSPAASAQQLIGAPKKAAWHPRTGGARPLRGFVGDV